MASDRKPGELSELPLFRPSVTAGRSPERVPQFKSGVLARLARGTPRSSAQVRSRGAARVRSAVSVGPQARRVVVKARFHRMNARGAKAAALHLAYIQRDGVEQDGSPGKLYGESGELRSADFLGGQAAEPRQFRFVVAPEDGADLDLTAFTKRLMARMEADLGTQLKWAAVNHYNTDNPHVHLVVRGLDKAGQEVRIPPEYMGHGLRARAQELATRELGLRTEQDVHRQLDKEVTAERFTTLDRQLDQHMRGNAVVFAGNAPPLLRARLGNLEKLGLAERKTPSEWELEPGWREALKERAIKRDIIKQLNRDGYVSAASIRIAKDASEIASPVDAKLVRKVLADELRGDMAGVFAASDGSTVYMPLAAQLANQLREGQVVELARGQVAPLTPQTLTEQISYRGPTYLDRCVANAGDKTIARTGFGAELRDAIEQRHAFLRGHQIDLRGPDAKAKLEALERSSIEQTSARAAQRPVAPAETASALTQARFAGLVEAPSGARFGVFHQDPGTRLFVVPMNADAKLDVGRTYTVERATGVVMPSTHDRGKDLSR